MRSSHSLDRLDVAFDDDRLVADAGLLLPASLAHHLGLRELVDAYLDLGDKPGRANVGDKLLTLVMSALAGGDCIDDANALRAGGTERVLGFRVKAASTLGADPPPAAPIEYRNHPPGVHRGRGLSALAGQRTTLAWCCHPGHRPSPPR